jgi:O-methyltransferase involved in polyketide biosynthesis
VKQDSPSQTALFISKVMYLNSKKYPSFVVPATKEIADRHVQEKDFPKLLKILLTTFWGRYFLEFFQDIILPGFTSHVQRRKWWIYNYTKAWGQQNPQGQLVIIGAGLDGLSLEMSRQNSFKKIIEIDHPATQNAKKHLVPNASIDFVPMDLTIHSIKDLQPQLLDAPTLLVWEGVSMYLVESDVQKFLKELSQILPKKSEMIWTYMIPDDQGQIRFHFGAGIIGWALALLKEPFIWGLSTEKLAGFVANCGWTLKKDLSTVDVEINVGLPCRGEKMSVIALT